MNHDEHFLVSIVIASSILCGAGGAPHRDARGYPEQVLQDRIQALHQQAERHTERIEAQLEAQRSEMLELQRGGNNEPV